VSVGGIMGRRPPIAMPATSPKQAARRLVDRLDDDASFEDIQYELYVVQQIERGLREVDEGKTVSHAEARTHLSRWLGGEPEGDA
jgi:predicted transcriptional regulator